MNNENHRFLRRKYRWRTIAAISALLIAILACENPTPAPPQIDECPNPILTCVNNSSSWLVKLPGTSINIEAWLENEGVRRGISNAVCDDDRSKLTQLTDFEKRAEVNWIIKNPDSAPLIEVCGVQFEPHSFSKSMDEYSSYDEEEYVEEESPTAEPTETIEAPSVTVTEAPIYVVPTETFHNFPVEVRVSQDAKPFVKDERALTEFTRQMEEIIPTLKQHKNYYITSKIDKNEFISFFPQNSEKVEIFYNKIQSGLWGGGNYYDDSISYNIIVIVLDTGNYEGIFYSAAHEMLHDIYKSNECFKGESGPIWGGLAFSTGIRDSRPDVFPNSGMESKLSQPAFCDDKITTTTEMATYYYLGRNNPQLVDIAVSALGLEYVQSQTLIYYNP